jgi:hypothetical protein
MDRADAALGQDPAERSFGDRDPLALGQQLGEVSWFTLT